MVSPAHRDAIVAECNRDRTIRHIEWVFPEVPGWKLVQAKEPKWERTYNLLWQVQALRAAQALQRESCFDLVHHLTWGGIRAPTFLGFLCVPLIIGPVGGGETSPASLRNRFPPRGRRAEWLRNLSNTTIEFNPLVRSGLRDAAVIFARTVDTRYVLGKRLREKTHVMMELGVLARQIGSAREKRSSPRRLLYAGRLIYWKGVHIAIEAMATLVTQMPDAHLTIVGYGPEEGALRQDVARRGISANVSFIPWMPQDAFMRLYDENDIFLFPSLHDSTGWVVLEALCKGMPVVCLDLGGPKEIVTPACGAIVETCGLDTSEVAMQMANRLYRLLSDPAQLARLSAGAVARAHDFLLSDQVTRLYNTALQTIRAGQTRRLASPPAREAASERAA